MPDAIRASTHPCPPSSAPLNLRRTGTTTLFYPWREAQTPMSIDTDTVRKVAHLARIAVREDELEPLAAELNLIIGWIEQLGEVDVTGIEPMTSVTPMALKRRADEVTDGSRQGDILANAPDAREGFFTVPKVVE